MFLAASLMILSGSAPVETASRIWGIPAVTLRRWRRWWREDFPATAVRAALRVTNGRIVAAKRAVAGQNRRITVQVRPGGVDDVTVSLPATADCVTAGAICTADGRKLSSSLTATVRGPVAISVADAEAREGEDAAVVFTVTLSRAASGEVAVDYATRDGTAKAGEDYAFTRGTLTFAAGDTEGTVSVPVIDDEIDEGEETFTLRLTNPRGAAIDDGEATGTIINDDPIPTARLARFGRTVAEQSVDAVRERMSADRTPGFRGRIAGEGGDEAQTRSGNGGGGHARHRLRDRAGD